MLFRRKTRGRLKCGWAISRGGDHVQCTPTLARSWEERLISMFYCAWMEKRHGLLMCMKEDQIEDQTVYLCLQDTNEWIVSKRINATCLLLSSIAENQWTAIFCKPCCYMGIESFVFFCCSVVYFDFSVPKQGAYSSVSFWFWNYFARSVIFSILLFR